MHGQRIVALHQHMAAPLAHAYHEHFDFEIGRGLPLRENFENSLLGILVLDR